MFGDQANLPAKFEFEQPSNTGRANIFLQRKPIEPAKIFRSNTVHLSIEARAGTDSRRSDCAHSTHSVDGAPIVCLSDTPTKGLSVYQPIVSKSNKLRIELWETAKFEVENLIKLFRILECQKFFSKLI